MTVKMIQESSFSEEKGRHKEFRDFGGNGMVRNNGESNFRNSEFNFREKEREMTSESAKEREQSCGLSGRSLSIARLEKILGDKKNAGSVG